jgi:hyaluronoglucosaminidase
MLRWLSERGLNSYTYAPKRDPLHRGVRWVEPYPAGELDRFAELASEGEGLGVRVTVAIAPARVFGRNNISRWADRDGDGIHDGQWQALAAKLTALQGVGIRSFALLFDDTAATFVPSLGGRSKGRFHGRIARRAQEHLGDGSLYVVPAVYSRTWAKQGGAGRRYWEALARELPAGIPVAWTGPRVFSRSIRGVDVRELSEQTGLPILIWNNAVVNDWIHLATGEAVGLRGWRKLSFGPGHNLDAEVLDASAGVILNGALEAELTKVPTACFADFVRDPSGYDPDVSHARALAAVSGTAGAEVLTGIYELCRNHLLMAPQRRECPGLYEAAQAGDQAAVRRELEAIVAVTDRAAELPPALAEEVGPTARKAGLLARAALDGSAAARAEARRIKWFVARRPFAKVHRLR